MAVHEVITKEGKLRINADLTGKFSVVHCTNKHNMCYTMATYDKLEDAEKGLVRNAAWLERCYQARKTSDCDCVNMTGKDEFERQKCGRLRSGEPEVCIYTKFGAAERCEYYQPKPRGGEVDGKSDKSNANGREQKTAAASVRLAGQGKLPGTCSRNARTNG